MLKEIIAVFRKDSLMDQAYQRSFEMLYLTQEMYQAAKKILRETEDNVLEIDINAEDSTINKYQRNVRRDVFNHLVLTGSDELPSGLSLVSIIIDIERIGDFTKNIAAIAQNYNKVLLGGKFEDRIKKIEIAVDECFDKSIEIFKNADEEKGLEFIKEYKWLSKETDDIIDALIKEDDPDIKPGAAAALTLYLRSIKRVSSHLRNVVTSVVNPFHRIGFKPKKNKK